MMFCNDSLTSPHIRCGTLALENKAKLVGHEPISLEVKSRPIVPIILSTGEEITVPILGFCREESNPPVNSIRSTLRATEYTEKDSKKGLVSFQVPNNKVIAVYVVSNPNFPGNGKGAFIITRPVTKEEKLQADHLRHPLLIED